MQRKTSNGKDSAAIKEGVVRMTLAEPANPESIYGEDLQTGQVNYLNRDEKWLNFYRRSDIWKGYIQEPLPWD